MAIRRLTVPTYFGGLTGGDSYINNAISGTPAPASAVKVGGTNAGTFFVAFGEPATSSNTNRGLKALAENTDQLDTWFKTSQVCVRYIDGTVGGSPITSLAITGEVYVGSSTDSPATVNDQETRDRLMHIVDQDDLDMESGAAISLIHDGANNNQVGVPVSGFFTNPTVNFSNPLPAGTGYRIYYLARRSAFDIITKKPGEYFYEQIRRSTRLDGETRRQITLISDGGYGTYLWNDPPPTSLTDVALGGLDTRYRQGRVKPTTTPDADRYPLNTLDRAGAGGWIRRDGPAISVYSNNSAMYVDPTQALHRLVINDTTQSRGSVGLLVEDSYREGYAGNYLNESDRFTSFASFLVADVRRPSSFVAVGCLSSIVAGASCTLTSPTVNSVTGESVVALGTGRFRAPGGDTDVALGWDIIRLRFTQAAAIVVRDYVITAFGATADPTSTTKARVRCLDGSVPDFTGATAATVVEWLRWSFGRGSASGKRFIEANGGSVGSTPNIEADGLTFIAPGESNVGMYTSQPTPNGMTVATRGRIANGSDPFYILRVGQFYQGAFSPIMDVFSGDQSGATSNRPYVTFYDSKLLLTRSIGSRFGTWNTTIGAQTFTSATTTFALALNTTRWFDITCDTTVTFGQSVSLTFDAIIDPSDAASGMRLIVKFKQQASGAGSGTADITWPVAAKFSSNADKHPATGLGAITIWEGFYITSESAWFFTKRVY